MANPWKHPQSGIYYHRILVPKDLHATIGKSVIKFTLKIRDFAEASGGTTLMIVMKQGASVAAMRMLAEMQAPQLQVIAGVIAATLSKHFRGVPFRAKTTMKPLINPKPLRVLMTLANSDYSILQVADCLHISVVTANKHLESVRKTLGVRTNYAAIKKALCEGYIEYH